jgi:hypothetical protein
MHFLREPCPLCSTPTCHIGLAFWRCGDGTTIVVLCPECEAVWLGPRQISDQNGLSAGLPPGLIRELGIQLGGPAAGWASEDEINGVGWLGEVDVD